jgi:hypothetical protein
LSHAGHGPDWHSRLAPGSHKKRQHELLNAEPGFSDERPQRRCAA